MTGVVISIGDHDHDEAAGGLVDGTADRELCDGMASPTIQLCGAVPRTRSGSRSADGRDRRARTTTSTTRSTRASSIRSPRAICGGRGSRAIPPARRPRAAATRCGATSCTRRTSSSTPTRSASATSATIRSRATACSARRNAETACPDSVRLPVHQAPGVLPVRRLDDVLAHRRRLPRQLQPHDRGRQRRSRSRRRSGTCTRTRSPPTRGSDSPAFASAFDTTTALRQERSQHRSGPEPDALRRAGRLGGGDDRRRRQDAGGSRVPHPARTRQLRDDRPTRSEHAAQSPELADADRRRRRTSSSNFWESYLADNGPKGTPGGHVGGVWNPNVWNSARMDTAEVAIFAVPGPRHDRGSGVERSLAEHVSRVRAGHRAGSQHRGGGRPLPGDEHARAARHCRAVAASSRRRMRRRRTWSATARSRRMSARPEFPTRPRDSTAPRRRSRTRRSSRTAC